MLIKFATENPGLFILLVWPLLTAFVTGLFGLLGHMSETDYAKLPKWASFLLQWFAKSGVDAPAVLKLLWSLFGKGGPAAGAMLIVLALTGVQACSFFQGPKGQATVMFGFEELACIYEHDSEPPLQIAEDCLRQTGPDILHEIETLLAAKKAGEARKAAHRTDAGQ